MPLPRADFPTTSKTVLEFEKLQHASNQRINRTISTPLVELGSPLVHNRNTHTKTPCNKSGSTLRKTATATTAAKKWKSHEAVKLDLNPSASSKASLSVDGQSQETHTQTTNENTPKNTSEVQLLCGEVVPHKRTNPVQHQPLDQTKMHSVQTQVASNSNVSNGVHYEGRREHTANEARNHARIVAVKAEFAARNALVEAARVRNSVQTRQMTPNHHRPQHLRTVNTEQQRTPNTIEANARTNTVVSNPKTEVNHQSTPLLHKKIFLDISNNEVKQKLTKEINQLGGVSQISIDFESVTALSNRLL